MTSEDYTMLERTLPAVVGAFRRYRQRLSLRARSQKTPTVAVVCCLVVLFLAYFILAGALGLSGFTAVPHSRKQYWPHTAIKSVKESRKHPAVSGKYMVIGVPTMARPQGHYLSTTLQSLLSNMHEDDRKDFLLVVYVADLNTTIADQTVKELHTNYSSEVSDGLMEVVRAPPPHFYPPMDGMHGENYGSQSEKAFKRQKQSLDYALLMAYCRPKATHYMQLEDDVITIPGYTKTIRRVIGRLETQGRGWYMLDFSILGFIGKTFRTKEMDQLVDYLSKTYAEAPADILLYQVLLRHGHQRLGSKVSLFQHIGTFSSLDGKPQLLKDPRFPLPEPYNPEIAGLENAEYQSPLKAEREEEEEEDYALGQDEDDERR